MGESPYNGGENYPNLVQRQVSKYVSEIVSMYQGLHVLPRQQSGLLVTPNSIVRIFHFFLQIRCNTILYHVYAFNISQLNMSPTNISSLCQHKSNFSTNTSIVIKLYHVQATWNIPQHNISYFVIENFPIYIFSKQYKPFHYTLIIKIPTNGTCSIHTLSVYITYLYCSIIFIVYIYNCSTLCFFLYKLFTFTSLF